jgi:hypothetical protein
MQHVRQLWPTRGSSQLVLERDNVLLVVEPNILETTILTRMPPPRK